MSKDKLAFFSLDKLFNLFFGFDLSFFENSQDKQIVVCYKNIVFLVKEKLRKELSFSERKEKKIKGVNAFDLLRHIAIKIEYLLQDFSGKKSKKEESLWIKFLLKNVYFLISTEVVFVKKPIDFMKIVEKKLFDQEVSKERCFFYHIDGMEDFLGEQSFDIIQKSISKVLKVPDPIFLQKRMANNLEVGVLSRIQRNIVGQRFKLMNEKLRRYSSVYFFGEVEVCKEKKIESVFHLQDNSIDGVSFLEYMNEKDFYYYSLSPVSINSPQKIDVAVRGGRFNAIDSLCEMTYELKELLSYITPETLSGMNTSDIIEISAEFLSLTKELEITREISNSAAFLVESLSEKVTTEKDEEILSSLKKIAEHAFALMEDNGVSENLDIAAKKEDENNNLIMALNLSSKNMDWEGWEVDKDIVVGKSYDSVFMDFYDKKILESIDFKTLVLFKEEKIPGLFSAKSIFEDNKSNSRSDCFVFNKEEVKNENC